MTTELCGYAILAFSEKNNCHAEPLAYGVEGEPHPEILLRRKRIECFDSEEAAEAAVKQTHDSESAAGSEWIKTFQFAVVKIVRTGAMVPA